MLTPQNPLSAFINGKPKWQWVHSIHWRSQWIHWRVKLNYLPQVNFFQVIKFKLEELYCQSVSTVQNHGVNILPVVLTGGVA